MKKKIMTFGIGIAMGAIVLAGCGGAASSAGTEATTTVKLLLSQPLQMLQRVRK